MRAAGMSEQRIYMRIADDLRSRIKDGTLKPGEMVPRRETFMRQYGCRHRTVTTAIMLVESEGLIYRVRGKGYFVPAEADEPNPVLHLRIADDLRDQIAAGILKPGDQPPSITALAVIYECNRSRATQAMRALETERLVYRVKGLGYFVADPQ